MFSPCISRIKGHGNGSWPLLVLLLALLLGACRHAVTPASDESDSAQVASSLVRPLAVDTAFDVINYDSQMDADTLLFGRSAWAVTTSRSRLAMYQRQGKAKDWEVLCAIPEQWSLVVCGSLRARRVKDMRGLTIASAREDASQIILQQILREAGVKPSDVYHPQIHSLPIRARMLTNNQVDGAMLPAPYDSLAHAVGHRIIKTVTDTTQTVILVRHSATPSQRKQLYEKLQLD